MELAKAKGEVPVNKISFTSNNKLVTIVKKSTGVGLAISQLSADYLKKKHFTFMGHVILVSGYTVTCQLTTTWMCKIRLQVTTLARKCEISHWLPVWARTVT